ncbi:MAG: Clp protease N-terminal domain-containing protein [Acidimicrobiales bacterium]
MFERFTDRARRVLVVAQDEARQMGHRFIGPEHLLLGLCEGEGLASTALAECAVDVAAVRAKVEQRIESSPQARMLHKVPFSPEAKKSLELALRTALRLGHNYIGTEHLFMGLRDEAKRRSETLDDLLGVPASSVQDRLMELLRGGGAPTAPLAPAMRLAMDLARRSAAGLALTTGHLLSSLVSIADSQAAKALGALGVSEEAVASALGEIDVSTTSDATEAAQALSIVVGGSTKVIGDPDIVGAVMKLTADQLRAVLRQALDIEPRELER